MQTTNPNEKMQELEIKLLELIMQAEDALQLLQQIHSEIKNKTWDIQ